MEEQPGPKRLTRNWNELLQELRVVQTGVQILTGFLLTVPFSNRFSDLSPSQVRVYLAVLCGSTLTTAFVVAPVAFHRVLFRDRKRRWLVRASNICARIGLALLAATSSGVLFLVFDVVLGLHSATVALVGSALSFGVLWLLVPLLSSPQFEPPPEQESGEDEAKAGAGADPDGTDVKH